MCIISMIDLETSSCCCCDTTSNIVCCLSMIGTQFNQLWPIYSLKLSISHSHLSLSIHSHSFYPTILFINLRSKQVQQSQSAEEAASPVDEQGRFKLFTHVSRVSVAFFFFILMWRTVHHYELADATFGKLSGTGGGLKSALLRTIIVTPLVVLFLGEMMGALLGITGGGGIGATTSANHTTKKRLKGILNLHKFVELVMIVYNVFRLAIWPSKYVMREVYIGRTISNFFFLIQAQLYTKLSW